MTLAQNVNLKISSSKYIVKRYRYTRYITPRRSHNVNLSYSSAIAIRKPLWNTKRSQPPCTIPHPPSCTTSPPHPIRRGIEFWMILHYFHPFSSHLKLNYFSIYRHIYSSNVFFFFFFFFFNRPYNQFTTNLSLIILARICSCSFLTTTLAILDRLESVF